MTNDIVTIGSAALTAEINPFGAELWRLRDGAGRDLLWNGDEAWWTGRAPLLFPVIGRLADDRFTHEGETYELPKHGFARRRRFEVVATEPRRARFRLAADAQTRRAYPFEFALEAEFSVEGPALRMAAQVENRGGSPLPATFGFHPAFRWPLPDAGPRERHAIVFAEPEDGPLRRIGADGLLDRAPRPSPVEGRRLALQDGFFVEDALVFERIASRSLRFGGEAGPTLTIEWEGLPHLGVWTKPGAPYLCVEPWHDLPAETGAPAELLERPGLFVLAPGETTQFAMTVRVD